jgi:hypothetical protein
LLDRFGGIDHHAAKANPQEIGRLDSEYRSHPGRSDADEMLRAQRPTDPRRVRSPIGTKIASNHVQLTGRTWRQASDILHLLAGFHSPAFSSLLYQ